MFATCSLRFAQSSLNNGSARQLALLYQGISSVCIADTLSRAQHRSLQVSLCRGAHSRAIGMNVQPVTTARARTSAARMRVIGCSA
jgi:hypothetical protein